jgi:hypothetical protein
MSDIFYLRSIDPPMTPRDVVLTDEAGDCFKLHRVNWRHSFLSADGARMLCWYEAPDAESARIALRRLRASTEGVFAGTVIGEDDPDSPAMSAASFVAELRYSAPSAQDAFAAVSTAFRERDITLVRGFASIREPKGVCIVRATNDRSVRSALERAAVVLDAVWQCTPIVPPVR